VSKNSIFPKFICTNLLSKSFRIAIVGGISGLILYFVLGSRILPIELAFPNDFSKLLGFAVIGFVSGFSERLIKDVIDKTEDTISSKDASTSSTSSQASSINSIQISPPTIELEFGAETAFTITPEQFFTVKIIPQELGRISQQTSGSLSYVAPSEEEAQASTAVSIIVVSQDNLSQAAAVITFKKGA
jgi:hypothetical protein